MIVIFSAREALYMFPLDWQKPLVLILMVCKNLVKFGSKESYFRSPFRELVSKPGFV